MQNVSEKAKDFVIGKTDFDNKIVLVITTDEATYNQGEPVVISVKKIGDQTLTFSDSALGIEIQNVGGGQNYSITAAQVITELSPDESKRLTWDEDAPADDYAATMQTTGERNTSAKVSFKITG